MNNNYYPFKRVKDKIGKEEAEQVIVTHRERNCVDYLFADNNGEWLKVSTNGHYKITSVTFTPKYKGIGLSLKRAQRKGYKACWFIGLSNRQG